MAKPKEERNKLILELREKGYTYRQIFEELQKRGYRGLRTIKSVGMQLSRLKARETVPTLTHQRVGKVTVPRRHITKESATRPPVPGATEKMAFWLDRDIKEKPKILAIKERRTASDIVRETLGQYLKNK